MKKIILSLVGLFALAGVAYASTVPITPAVFETYLATQQSTSDTSITLASNKLLDGTTLSGYVCLTIDTNTPTLEYECGTAATSSLTITGLTRGIDPTTGTTSVTALKFTHRRGADVKVTDYPALTIVSRIVNGLDTFVNKLKYDASSTISVTGVNDIPNKGYVDTAIGSATSSLNTAILGANNTWTGSNIYNGVVTLASSTINGLMTFNAAPNLGGFKITNLGTPTANTDAATKAYADGISTAGAPISNNTTTGIGRTASSTQISRGYSSTTPYFIPSSLASSTASTTANIVVVANSNGVIDSSFIASSTLQAAALVNTFSFGDGSDGNVTISSPTTLTRDMYYNNLVVNSTLTTDGFQIFVKDTISGTGTTTWGTASNGGNASGRTGGTGAGTTSVAGLLKNVAGGGGGLGGIYNGTSAGADGGATSQLHSIGQINTFGGNGGNDNSTGGGSGATALSTSTSQKFPVYAFPVLRMLDFNDTSFSKLYGSLSGNGGGGGGAFFSGNSGGGGGGGGASGGTIFIAAKNWAGSFTIYSKGGNGGNGGNPSIGQQNPGSGGGGAGGSGGTAVIIYGTKTWSGSYSLIGGSGGSAGVGGTVGTVGSTGLTGISYEIPITSLTR